MDEGLTAARDLPAYEQAAAVLEAEIRSGKLGADKRLLSERALAQRLGVSRITIRRALALLAEKDLVRSAERSGWFTVPVSQGSDAMVSFTEQGRQRGLAVSSRVLRCAPREATLAEAEELGVAPGSPVCDLARIRCFDGLPIAVTDAVVPSYLAPGLHEHDFSTLSLYDVLRTEYGVVPARGRFAIQAQSPDPDTARHLDMPPGDPVLIFSQSGYDQLGRVFELARTIYRADRYVFRGTLVADSDGDTPLVRESVGGWTPETIPSRSRSAIIR
jgi:GntR family transcriptional regulator